MHVGSPLNSNATSKEVALRLIEHSSKRSHAILTSKIMRSLAKKLGANEEEWELVGLLHDLDYDQVKDDMTRHGIIAARVLEDKLSLGALHAIRAHDHRTGIKPHSLLDNALIVADTVTILIEDLQARNSPITPKALKNKIHQETLQKPWLKSLTQTQKTLGMSTQQLLKTATEQLH